MDRRTFIQNTGIIGGAAMLPLYGFSEFNQPKFKLGYQLYSIRDAMEKNPLKTLKALKAMGYQDFETYGFDDQKGNTDSKPGKHTFFDKHNGQPENLTKVLQKKYRQNYQIQFFLERLV